MPEKAFASDVQTQWPSLRQQLLAWHRSHGRHGLPWHTQDPYAIWVSEVMLQQTQVSTGLVRYPAWMARFPTVQSLAAAPLDEILGAWEGLGYYARARNLHAAAQRILSEHGGVFPYLRADRLALPGVGPSTASAIGAFAFGEREAIFDGNVARVWSRWWGDRVLPETPAARQRFWWGLAQAATPSDPKDIRIWTQAIMDLGATVCTPRRPACPQCPWKESCRALALGDPEAWPLKGRRAPRSEWLLPWAWVVRDERVAVLQRPAGGVWPGLWSLPEIAMEEGAVLATGRHELSHRKVRWSLRRSPGSWVPDPPVGVTWEWVTAEQLAALALPRPLRRWWDGLSETDRAALFHSPS